MKTLSAQRALPSIDWGTPFSASSDTCPSEAKTLPWSEFTIPGVPCSSNALAMQA